METPLNQPVSLSFDQIRQGRDRFMLDTLFDLMADVAFGEVENVESMRQVQQQFLRFLNRFEEGCRDADDNFDVEAFFDQIATENNWPLYVNSLTELHDGDCVGHPSSCLRCHAERLIGINTVTWSGKAEGHRLFNAYMKETSND